MGFLFVNLEERCMRGYRYKQDPDGIYRPVRVSIIRHVWEKLDVWLLTKRGEWYGWRNRRRQIRYLKKNKPIRYGKDY